MKSHTKVHTYFKLSLANLFSTLVKESQGGVLGVSKASLLNECSEDLGVKEVREKC